MVSSSLYVAEDGWLFVAFRAPHLHYQGRTQSLAGRRESPGRPGTRRPYEPGDDPTVHRGRHGGQAQARGATLTSWGCGVCGRPTVLRRGHGWWSGTLHLPSTPVGSLRRWWMGSPIVLVMTLMRGSAAWHRDMPLLPSRCRWLSGSPF